MVILWYYNGIIIEFGSERNGRRIGGRREGKLHVFSVFSLFTTFLNLEKVIMILYPDSNRINDKKQEPPNHHIECYPLVIIQQ